MKKILILGSSGAGKSTLAKKMGKILNFKVIHLDYYFWKPGWIQTPREEWKQVQVELICKNKNFIIDGNFHSTIETRFPYADTIIYLDFNKYLCLFRALKRYFQHRNKARPDMNSGCKEKIDIAFIKWIWNFNKEIKPYLMNLIKNDSKNKEIFILKSDRDIKRFLSKIKQRKNETI